jgi:DNA-binding response OmpR family regulator
MIEMTLRSKNYTVVLANDGMEALDTLERNSFDLAILDINMPRLDGLSLLKALRERAEWAKLPILMLTTEGQEADRERALKLGATDYLTKPFKHTQLLERVANLLNASA